MKKTIVVADRDESLQHAFMTVFSKAHFEIIHASNGKEVERIAEKMNPDVYIVNVDLPKTNGIEVYKKLQKLKLLDNASFFFLKDESDTTELLGYQADGVIEKPINFFRVYETVTREDEAIELTDLIDDTEDRDDKKETPSQHEEESATEEEIRLADLVDATPIAPESKQEEDIIGYPEMPVGQAATVEEFQIPALTDEEMRSSIRQIGARLAAEIEATSALETAVPPPTPEVPEEEPLVAAEDVEAPEEITTTTPEHVVEEHVVEEHVVEEEISIEEELAREVQAEARTMEETKRPGAFGERLRDVMDNLTTGHAMSLADTMGGVAEMGEGQSELEAQFKTILNQALEEAALKLSGRLAPILTQYVEDYVKRMLLEIAEKVIREEIEKLLKESTE